jgi:DNA repair exonuclease SbcCD nuclease subunit
MEETESFLCKLVDFCKNFTELHNPNEVRIVIAGDLFDQKITVSNESTTYVSWLLRRLNEIATTYVICGNHDYLMNNSTRMCSLTPIFTMSNFDNCIYLDKEIGYASGIYEDDNIAFCLFSTFEDFNRPEIDIYKQNNPNKVLIGLIHADINGASTDVGRITDKGLNAEHFSNLDFVICGHIHKRQEIKKNGVKIVYCGSLIQQNMGENIYGHGGVIWDVENKTWNGFDLEIGEYGFFKFIIDDVEDIENNNEKLINI